MLLLGFVAGWNAPKSATKGRAGYFVQNDHITETGSLRRPPTARWISTPVVLDFLSFDLAHHGVEPLSPELWVMGASGGRGGLFNQRMDTRMVQL